MNVIGRINFQDKKYTVIEFVHTCCNDRDYKGIPDEFVNCAESYYEINFI